MRKLLIPMLASVLILTGCSSSKATFNLPLSPIPYIMKVDAGLVTHLSVVIPTNDFAKAAKKDGATAQVIIYYQPASGEKTIFMTLYSFPEKAFDRLKNPNEPPAYGQEVIRRSGDVLSVAGPSDSIFDPKSADGKNVTALYATIYKASTYSPAQ